MMVDPTLFLPDFCTFPPKVPLFLVVVCAWLDVKIQRLGGSILFEEGPSFPRTLPGLVYRRSFSSCQRTMASIWWVHSTRWFRSRWCCYAPVNVCRCMRRYLWFESTENPITFLSSTSTAISLDAAGSTGRWPYWRLLFSPLEGHLQFLHNYPSGCLIPSTLKSAAFFLIHVVGKKFKEFLFISFSPDYRFPPWYSLKEKFNDIVPSSEYIALSLVATFTSSRIIFVLRS